MGGGMSAPETPKRLAIVGLGYGGALLLRQLVKKGWLGPVFNVTAFEKKDGFVHNIAAPRTIVQEGWAEKAHWSYDLVKQMVAKGVKGDVTQHFRLIQGNVTGITRDTINYTDASGEKSATFDYIVVATGSTVPFPGKSARLAAAENIALLNRVREAIAAAKSVVVIGGGPTGIETAGEIGYMYGSGKGAAKKKVATAAKTITLVHSGSALLDATQPPVLPKLQQRLLAKVQNLGVEVVFNAKADLSALESKDESKETDMPRGVSLTPVNLPLSNGSTINADVVITALGMRINSEAYATTLAAAVNERGQLRVNLKQEVAGLEGHVWALGDCCDTAEPKLAYVAGEQVKFLAKALAQYAVGAQAKVKPRKLIPAAAFVPVGPKDGAAQVKGMLMGKKMVTMIKSKNLFLNQFRADTLGKVAKSIKD